MDHKCSFSTGRGLALPHTRITCIKVEDEVTRQHQEEDENDTSDCQQHGDMEWAKVAYSQNHQQRQGADVEGAGGRTMVPQKHANSCRREKD